MKTGKTEEGNAQVEKNENLGKNTKSSPATIVAGYENPLWRFFKGSNW